MKLDRTNPRHLLIALQTLMFVLLVLLWRPFVRKDKLRRVTFFGHRLNGNLKAFNDYLLAHTDYATSFLGLDAAYCRELHEKGEITALSTTKFADAKEVAKTGAFITTHGIHFFKLLRSLTSIKFIDVWHGIPYKGFDEEDFAGIHGHDQIWVSSPAMKQMYQRKFGFSAAKVKVTGYARVDQLIDGNLDKPTLLKKYAIPKAEKYILIAPTWKQDDDSRNIVPFGVSDKKFFSDLDVIAAKHHARIIFRTHLNSSEQLDVKLSSTSFMPYAKYDLAEEFLFISDILVTDWSSIAFDYLPLKRPTIFLDIEAPFAKGFSFGPEHRFGHLAASLDELKKAIDIYLETPEKYITKYSQNIAVTTEVAYGNTLDGKSSERYFIQLKKLLDQNQA